MPPRQSEAAGQRDSAVRATPGFLASCFFVVQSHLLSIGLASPALNLEHWQVSSASSAAPHQHPSPPKAQLRAVPPAPPACSGQPGHCLCPAPWHPPWLPCRCCPAREGWGQKPDRRHHSPFGVRARGGICRDYTGGITKEQTFPQTLQSPL